MHGKRSVYFLNTHYNEFSLLITHEQLMCWCYSVVTLLLYFVDGEQGSGLDFFESLLWKFLFHVLLLIGFYAITFLILKEKTSWGHCL
jgi:hypothetical protein